MLSARSLLLAPALVLLSLQAGAWGLAPSVNLAADAERARELRLPLIVKFYLDHCEFCDYVENYHLRHLLDNQTIALSRVNLSSNTPIVGFDGGNTTAAKVAELYAAKLSPTLIFVDYDGVTRTDDLIGVPGGEDFYSFYLQKRLDGLRAYLASAGNN